MTELFDMGKYAVYVWSSYAITLVVLVLNFVLPLMHHNKQVKILKRKLRADRLQK